MGQRVGGAAMSATVVEIRKPFWGVEDLLDRIRETWEEIPSPDAHLDADDDDNECVGDWEGATPDGYAYAPGSEVESCATCGSASASSNSRSGTSESCIAREARSFGMPRSA